MPETDLNWLSATEQATLIRSRKVSPVEIVDALLARIDKVNPRLNAFVLINADQARREAKSAERAVGKRGARLGPLHGVPFGVKDLVVTRGVRTTFGTPLYRDNVPTEDAPMVERLKAAGGIMVGKTNTPTFGWIGATHNLVFGPTRNPWHLDRTPGGSSGGASAAVAAGMGALHVGTDGGGSIRIPASCAGIYGFKPSYGRIPLHPPSGAWSLSHIGPMTRTVADAALTMDICAGPDERDPYSLPADGTRYARGLGGRVEEVQPKWPSMMECWEQIFCGGIATRMAPYLDQRDLIEPGLLRFIDATLKNPPTRYVQAWLDRLNWWQHPRAFFEKYDLLLTPTIACAPFKVGLDTPGAIAGRAVSFYGWIPFTPAFNLTGQPAASVPCGFTKDGLPIGLQIVGRRFADTLVLRASAAFERARPWRQQRPSIG